MSSSEETWGGLPVVRKLACARPRNRVIVTGNVTAAAQGRLGSSRAYLCRLDDGTGKITLAFTGRSIIPGLVVGVRCKVEGTAQMVDGQLVVPNPEYEYVS